MGRGGPAVVGDGPQAPQAPPPAVFDRRVPETPAPNPAGRAGPAVRPRPPAPAPSPLAPARTGSRRGPPATAAAARLRDLGLPDDPATAARVLAGAKALPKGEAATDEAVRGWAG